MESVLVALVVGGALIYLIRRWRKTGQGQCSCGCKGCSKSKGCSPSKRRC